MSVDRSYQSRLLGFGKPAVYRIAVQGQLDRHTATDIADARIEAGNPHTTRLLVRERNYMPIMTAISKMTYLTAKWLEEFIPDFKQIGRLKPGANADITIFNPDTVSDNAVAETGKFALPSTGIPYVIVNGTTVVKDSEVLKVYPGKAIRGSKNKV